MKIDMKKSALLLVSVAVLCGCDHKAATESNIKHGLNHYLARLEPCPNYWATQFPMTVQAGPQPGPLDALAEVGLVSKAAGPFNPSGKPTFIYTLTDKGRDSAFHAAEPVHPGPTRLFCFGKLEVKDVLNFTIPAPREGLMELHTRYTVKLTDTSSWADNADMQKAFGNLTTEYFAKQEPRESVMALTNNGWRAAGDE